MCIVSYCFFYNFKQHIPLPYIIIFFSRPSSSRISGLPYAWATSLGVSTPDSGRKPRGRNEVAGMGMGSNTHQTMQITVTPNVIDASAENPPADMRYAAAKARMGPAGKASCLNDLIEKVLAKDINGP